MEGQITYRFETPAYPGNILYVNLIAKYSCPNDCLFCDRPRTKDDVGKPNIYEKKAGVSLYLSKSPSIDQIMESIDREIKEDDKELAIVGLGEPLMYLDKVVEVVKRVKEKYSVKTRVDTDGVVKCLYENAAQRLEEAGLDEIRISLNAINVEEYNKLCRPGVDNAFENLVKFIKECVDSNIDTYVSFVVDFEAEGIRKRTEQEYTDFAVSLGIKPENVIRRDYLKPIS